MQSCDRPTRSCSVGQKLIVGTAILLGVVLAAAFLLLIWPQAEAIAIVKLPPPIDGTSGHEDNLQLLTSNSLLENAVRTDSHLVTLRTALGGDPVEELRRRVTVTTSDPDTGTVILRVAAPTLQQAEEELNAILDALLDLATEHKQIQQSVAESMDQAAARNREQLEQFRTNLDHATDSAAKALLRKQIVKRERYLKISENCRRFALQSRDFFAGIEIIDAPGHDSIVDE